MLLLTYPLTTLWQKRVLSLSIVITKSIQLASHVIRGTGVTHLLPEVQILARDHRKREGALAKQHFNHSAIRIAT
jgi:hypothetical protein